MKRLNSKPKDLKIFTCPQCDKQRMTRELDHEVNHDKQSYKTKDNTEIELFVDICNWCKRRNFTKFFEPSKADVRRVLKTLKEDAQLSDNQSLEDLL